MIYRMEDYHIRQRIGRSAPTGTYTTTRNGYKKAVTKFAEFYKTEVGEFTPEEWRSRMLECIEASNSQALLQKLMERCKEHCAWLKTDKDREEYSLGIIAGRVYKCGSNAWKDFDTSGITENTAFVFTF